MIVPVNGSAMVRLSPSFAPMNEKLSGSDNNFTPAAAASWIQLIVKSKQVLSTLTEKDDYNIAIGVNYGVTSSSSRSKSESLYNPEMQSSQEIKGPHSLQRWTSFTWLDKPTCAYFSLWVENKLWLGGPWWQGAQVNQVLGRSPIPALFRL